MIIKPQSGDALIVKKGSYLKITDIQGRQVSDLVLFNAHDTQEKISSGKTLDFEESLLITKGNYLWSNRSNKMAFILEDTNGRNDFLLAPCCPKTFAIMYQNSNENHPSCLMNLINNLDRFGITKDEIPTAFNIFMNVQFDKKGKLSVCPPTSVAGDHIIIELLMDSIVGITACSAEDSNGGTFKPIKYEIIHVSKT